MKAHLKNIIGIAALGMILLATTVPTWAGSVNTSQVLIGSNQLFDYANGSMVGARYSTDNKQSIGCRIETHFTPVATYVICYASDSTGKYFSCSSADPQLVEVAQGLTDSSYIAFQVNKTTASGCGRIVIYNGSDTQK